MLFLFTYKEENMRLCLKEIEVMKHAIGLDNIEGQKLKKYKPYRNYYDAGESDLKIWNGLVKKGLAEAKSNNLFIVTALGKQKLSETYNIEII